MPVVTLSDLLIPLCCFGAVVITTFAAYPVLAGRVSTYLDEQTQKATGQLEEMFVVLSRETVWTLYATAPFAVGLGAWLLTERVIFGLLGFALGILVPSIVIKQLDSRRRSKFQTQLVDGLLLLNSSLKAGLSMLQSFAAMAEEMPPPISQEFSLLLKETRMGINLDEAIKHLDLRMPSDDMRLFSTAVLVARESGGDVTSIFGRLVETLRERYKIKEKIKTLTFMARLQGIIMAMLPFAFAFAVYQMDKNYFTFFFTDPLGRMLLTIIIVLQVLGGVMFARFSRSPL
jgi:tight adherence protein B